MASLALAGLLVLSFLVRGSVLWAMRANLQQDPDAYREIAENLLRHGEFALGKPSPDTADSKPKPTAYRPPLYPVVLSNLPTADGQHVSLAKVAALHLALGLVTVWITWLTSKRMHACALEPEARQKIAPPVRAGIGDKNNDIQRSGGPTPRTAETGAGPPGLHIAALVAGLLVACDPILLNQQSLIMTETLAAFLAILSLWCLARFDAARSWFNAALAGGAIGLAVLCRPTFLPWLALIAIAMLVVRGRNSEFRIQNSERHWLSDFGWRLANLAGLVIAAAAVMSPWMIRNFDVFGEPILTTTHGGYTLYLGNNKSFYEYLASGNHDLPWNASSLEPIEVDRFGPIIGYKAEVLAIALREQERLGRERVRNHYPGIKESFEDGVAYGVAKWWIRNHPRDCFRACVYRLQQLWSPLPHKLTADESSGRRLLRYATCAWYCGVYVLTAVGIWRLRWRLLRPPWIWGVLLCLAFTAVHTFYWTNLRMRAPLIPFVALIASGAVGTKTEGRRDGGTERR